MLRKLGQPFGRILAINLRVDGPFLGTFKGSSTDDVFWPQEGLVVIYVRGAGGTEEAVDGFA